MAKTWLIGEHNPFGPDPHYALYPHPPGCAGWRLCMFLKLERAEYLRRFERRNLLTTARWSAPRAREAAAAIRAECAPLDRLILLGGKVAEAFGLDYRTNLCVPRVSGPPLMPTLVLPHPSGLSRAWNEPGMPARVRAAVAALENPSDFAEGVDD